MVRLSSSIFSAAFTVLVAFGTTGVNAACATNLVVDDFTNWSNHLNKVGEWTSDDGSMTSISASSTTKTLSFTPKANSYFYESFTCLAASTDKYNAIQFPFKGPAGGSFTLEIQTSSGGCSSATYQSFYKTVTGLTGATQTITVPLSGFTGANLAAIKAFVWEGFSSTSGTWQLGTVRMVCGSTSTVTTSAIVKSSVAASTTTKTSSATTLTTKTSSATTLTTKTSSATTLTTITSSATTLPATTLTTKTSSAAPTGTCAPLVIDDWASQSRLTFLFYNALIEPTSDDGTMTSIVVSNHRVTFTPKSDSYFYSNFGCLQATNKYGGISLRIKAAAGTTFTVELQSSATCSNDVFKPYDMTTTQLGWTFDGTEKLYNIPLSSFVGLDKDHIISILFSNFNNKAVTMGPMAFYCGTTVSEYVAPVSTVNDPTSTVALTTATPTSFVLDAFANADTNSLGLWHGFDDGMSVTYSGGKMTIKSTDTDYAWYTSLGNPECRDMTGYEGGYLHIVYSGSNKFTIALQQHNSACDSTIAPFPETWDVVDAARYAVSTTEIFVPLAHFNIDKRRVVSIALKAFTTTTATVFSKIEILKAIPAAQQSTVKIPSKLPTAPLIFSCTRPNSFAFAIDDGVPEFAQQVIQIIKEEGIPVTFFTVGAPLLDPSTNFSNVYKEMLGRGHQVALHSYTHPKMESLSPADIDWELQNDIDAVAKTLGITSTYFRPPFGNEGAHFRQRIAAKIPGSKLINWSVDVEDWLWAASATPEKQLEAFQRDVDKGGNLVVLHYLSSTTVGYLREFIQRAKKTGKTLMRVDQCLGDPNAPPL